MQELAGTQLAHDVGQAHPSQLDDLVDVEVDLLAVVLDAGQLGDQEQVLDQV